MTPLALIACEYGPIGLGPRSVVTTSLIECSPLQVQLEHEAVQRQRNFRNERETLQGRRNASSKGGRIAQRSGVIPVRTRRSDRRDRSRRRGAHRAYG